MEERELFCRGEQGETEVVGKEEEGRCWGWYLEQERERRHWGKEGSEELVVEGVLMREEMDNNMG